MTSNNINLELFKNIKPLKSALEKLKISTGKEAYKMVIGKKSDFDMIARKLLALWAHSKKTKDWFWTISFYFDIKVLKKFSRLQIKVCFQYLYSYMYLNRVTESISQPQLQDKFLSFNLRSNKKNTNQMSQSLNRHKQ